MASAVIAKGSASISINPQQTEARLVFIPDPQGDGWDASAVNKLASEQALGAFADPKVMDVFLAKAAKAKTPTPLEITYARGVDPEDPEPEKITWEALVVPGDMAPFQKEALDNAGPPEVIVVKQEKVKRETMVKKAGALPFIAGKEELAVSWEKKETREKVAVNPEVRQVKYADRGAKLGTVTPSVPGKLGKSVFGRPVAPKDAGENTCLFGKGISKENKGIFAQVSGFVRIGENWADMVPMAKHSWKITPGADGLTLILRFETGNARFEPPAGKEIIDAALEKGAAESRLVSAAELDKAIKEAVKTGQPLEAFPLFKFQEAEAAVKVNHDKTAASLFLRKGLAGALPLEMRAISQAIKSTDIRGYDTDKLKAAIHEFMHGKETEFSYVLAEGTLSTRGADREIQTLAALLSEEEQQKVLSSIKEWHSRDVLRESDVDPEAARLAFVKEGSVIAKVSERTKGEEGKDIYGNVIPGLPGNDPDIKLFGGIELRGQDITASKTGLLIVQASEKSFHGQVIDYEDAKIGVRLSQDAMEARGDFFREEGVGLPLTVEAAKKVFSSLGIKKGIDWGEVEIACAQARIHGVVSDRVFARGEAAVARGGAALKWLVAFNPSGPTREGAAAEKTAVIKAGTPILVMSEPIAGGRAGYDVKGNELPIDKETALSIEHDNSIRVEALGKGTRLIAARSGELSFYNGKGLKISPFRTITGDAGGDLNFSGEIQISGNVLPDCKILGGSHVFVDGMAESAYISAGGKVVLGKGFKGNGKGVLRARAGIVSDFVERASVTALGDIKLTKGSLLSSVKTNGKLMIVAEGGKLLGGVYQARYGIDAADVGSEEKTRTEISFGQDYILRNEMIACEEQIDKLKQNLALLEEKLKAYLQKKLPIPDNIKTEKIRLVKLQEQLNIKLFNMREKFEEHFDSEIRINGTIFPGVVIESHNRYYEIKQKRSRVIFYFDCESGRIKEKPMN